MSDVREVLEVDQWTSTGDLATHPWAALKAQGPALISGGDSAAARIVFGGHFAFKTVDPDGRPPHGRVWFLEGDDGVPVLYKTNYDSSD